MTDPHQKIEDEVKKTLSVVKGIAANKEGSDALESLYLVMKSWHDNYGEYFDTIRKAEELDKAQLLTNPKNACKNCGSKTEKRLVGTGPHAWRIVCGAGHFKRWQ